MVEPKIRIDMADYSQIFVGIPLLLSIAVMVMLIVIVAMMVDCAFGWRKAKERGEARTSYLFSRTLSKFMLYEGLLLIATCIDTLVHFAWYQFFTSIIYYVPVVCILGGVVLCCVEIWSMREKADEKTKKHLGEVVEVASKVAVAAAQSVVNKEAIAEAVVSALHSNSHPPEEEEGNVK